MEENKERASESKLGGFRDKYFSEGLLWFCRIFVGLLFTISGLIKVNDITGFAYKLEDYFNVFENDFGLPAHWFASWAILQSALISIFEVAVAITLLIGFWPRLTAGLLLGMIIFFTFLTGYSWLLERVQDCGCFGDALKLTPFQSFMKDVVLTVLIGYIYRYRGEIKPLMPPKLNASTAAIATLLTTFITYYCYAHLPIIDFRPACVGCNLKENVTEKEVEEGVFEAKLKSYSPMQNDCQVDEFKGNTLLFIIPKLHKLGDEEIKNLIQLYQAVKNDVQVLAGVSASPTSKVQEYKQKYNIPFCMSLQDETMLKTMIRSNPGFILLKDGIVIGQWHYNDIPSRETILKTLDKSK
ncbi:MAG: DoxX family protein [Bacteroidia bacterium]|nr:DoxX family protein [Bacteroidia bacterium]